LSQPTIQACYIAQRASATANNPTPAPTVNRDALLFEGVAEAAELEPVAAGDAVAWALTPPLTKPVSVSAGSEEPI